MNEAMNMKQVSVQIIKDERNYEEISGDDSLEYEYADDYDDIEAAIWNFTVNIEPRSAFSRSSIHQRKKLVFPAPPSGQKVRLRQGNGPYSGYLEVSHSNEWGFVCDSGTWTTAEANIVCKQLGFHRGIRSTTQGTLIVENCIELRGMLHGIFFQQISLSGYHHFFNFSSH